MSAGKAAHGKACVYCLRCFNYCPTYAIRYLGASNQKMEKKPPFRGPVPEFRPELVCQEDRGS
jgi:ferredoxin